MSYTSNYNLNIRLSALESKINNGVPTSSDLGDVLLNGNSAGATDIDMNLQSITNATSFVSGDNGNSIDVDGSSATLTIADNLGNINVITALGSSIPSPNADSILTTATTANATFYPTFLGATTGYNSAGVSTSLTFNPSTKTETLTDGVNSTILTPTSVSSTTFTGALSGTATTATNIAGGLGGSIPYQSAVNTTALLANGTSGQYLKSNGTTLAPSWATLPVNGINEVLATGNTATDKTLNMISTTTSPGTTALNLTSSVPGSGSTQILHDNFTTGNGTKILNMDFDTGITLNRVGATSLGYSDYTAMEFRMADSFPLLNSVYNAITAYNSIIYDASTYVDTRSNTSTPISNAIADSTYTATLLSNALNLFTNSVTTLRNAISNLGMTITGSAIGTTNAIDATNCLVSDTTNNRYALLTSNGSGTSVGQSNKPAIYLGKSAPGSATTADQTLVLTNNNINLFQTNNAQTTKAITMTTTTNDGGDIKVIGPSTTRFVQIKNPINNTTNSSDFKMQLIDDTDLFTTSSASAGKSYMDLVSTSSGAGNIGSVGVMLRRSKNVAVNDTLGMLRFLGQTTIGLYTEFSRITSIVNNVGSGVVSGSLLLSAMVNGVLSSFLELNGSDNQINAFKPIDMNNNSIVSSTGGITLDTSSSASGNPYITLTPKASGGYIILNNLPSGAGGPTGSLYVSGGVIHIN